MSSDEPKFHAVCELHSSASLKLSFFHAEWVHGPQCLQKRWPIKAIVDGLTEFRAWLSDYDIDRH